MYLGDIKFSAGVIRYYAGWCDKICGQTIPCDGDYFAVTKKQPVGICAAITPWNYPIAMFTLKLGKWMFQYCSVVAGMKSSEILETSAQKIQPFLLFSTCA